MAELNYMAGAGLYAGKTHRGSRRPRYKRFETAAEALRYAIENMPGSQLRGSVLEVEDARFNDKQIQALYDSPNYPLARGAQ